MHEEMDALESAFAAWRGELDQADDVLLPGLQV